MLTDDELVSVENIIKRLNETPKMTASELKVQRDWYKKKATEHMLKYSMSYGTAAGMPSILQQNYDDFQSDLNDISNNVVEQIKLVNQFLDLWFEKGEYPPPYYATRIAIILRKAKRKDLEISFLKAYCRHFRVGAKFASGKRLVERAQKAGAIK